MSGVQTCQAMAKPPRRPPSEKKSSPPSNRAPRSGDRPKRPGRAPPRAGGGERSARDEKPAGGERSARGEPSARGERAASGGKFSRDERPARGGKFSRDDRPARGGKFSRDDRPARGGKFSRDDRPARGERFGRGKRSSRGESADRGDAPPRERPIREDLVTQAALEAYALVRQEGRLADRALDFTLRRKANLYSNERRAVAERVYALLRRQITVDYLLSKARAGFSALTSGRQDLLRLCASRVLHGEDAADVAQSAGLSDEDARALDALPDAARSLNKLPEAQRFAISAALPDFLATRFRAEFGAEAAAAAEALNERAPLTARVNTLKTDRDSLMARLRDEGIDCRPTPLSPLGVFLETRINAFSSPAFREGLFELQDEGSQLLGMLVDPPPTRIVDACAGAGGKTLQLAMDMKNRGEIFALDVDDGRLDELRKRTRRAGVHNVRARVIPAEAAHDEGALADLAGKADRVLVDAPCSGTGTFRRKPDGRHRLKPEDLENHVARQKRLLAQFSGMVKGGGRIIYGTCSMLREENEAVVEHFLREHPQFQVKPISDVLGAELGAKVSRDGFLRLFPHKHGTDGFFGAILVRTR